MLTASLRTDPGPTDSQQLPVWRQWRWCCIVGHFLSDDTPVVALSTRWFDHKRRCNRNITIRGNGHRTMATVVDKCDAEHDYQSSCWRNIVNASKAVWRDLGVPRQKWGELGITWSDA
ncbi:LOW QUALITY PROTEIN: RlpA-like double-psi beta-barrel domain containing protein [Trema orientale]|uniref:RlpA-like double-psi beta-barrel domain containing protein n=1 Tax=Trema orientale TaxID=63057 RepID=A0A2P5F2P6_TREOI|nr:LOW QUALITY PROTEIN: RlpA-like double-psi beta-barrel domain containing protein [Trema orientale]